jgi:predicted TIM-barrel fold metal-dependent hydrolase
MGLREAQWLHEVNAQEGLPSAVVAWADLLAPDADARLARLAALPLVRGVRFKPATSRRPDQPLPAGTAGALTDPRWPAALERLARHGLAWDLRVPFWHLEQAARVVRQVPALAVVLEHAGLPWDRSEPGLAAWRAGMQALASCPNAVHVKLSEFGLRDTQWNAADNARIVREALAIFGWQRAMFGSNFPVASLRIDYPSLVRLVAREVAPHGAAALAAVFEGNARRFYQLAGPAA